MLRGVWDSKLNSQLERATGRVQRGALRDQPGLFEAVEHLAHQSSVRSVADLGHIRPAVSAITVMLRACHWPRSGVGQ